MTDDKGDGTAVADLAMTDDCRVGHVSTVPPPSHRLSSLHGKSGLLDLSLRFPPSQQRRHLELYENHRSHLGVTIEDTFGLGRFCGDEGCGECWEGREHLS